MAGKYKPGQSGNPIGRPKGLPNKATASAREAIAVFVDGNAGRLQGWLDKIADGVPRRDAQGIHMVDQQGNTIWDIPPNPEKAFTLFQSVVEYHVPKLGRQELTGPNGSGLTVQIVKLSDIPKLPAPTE